ncbi:hypothetical protein LZK98_06140 [Sphingomonas cannabina]|uniref:hypothetical protein n=1 Tax=Sphingomonas cannabina TaxID=2899123 RepID=UPI001F200E29|nr:hypothetical protein [Sphingomonas cannabina]UIJ46527.1 hypothetical protein LZK98_06140 [Sphingomonas cannabina]
MALRPATGWPAAVRLLLPSARDRDRVFDIGMARNAAGRIVPQHAFSRQAAIEIAGTQAHLDTDRLAFDRQVLRVRLITQ